MKVNWTHNDSIRIVLDVSCHVELESEGLDVAKDASKEIMEESSGINYQPSCTRKIRKAKRQEKEPLGKN